MIDLNTCLSIKHVTKIVGKDENKQSIFEKYVYSMMLLEQLKTLLGDKHYVFKGGTSLLLLFKESSRFSIDIDISMREEEFENREKIVELFKNNLKPPFTNVEFDDDRGHGGKTIKAAHYMFYYNPAFKTDESYILLDVIFQNNSITGKEMPISNPRLAQNGEPLTVNTIEIDDLLGDKLTAFAPNTIGVKYTAMNQYGRPKCTEIIKQLYDCAYLAPYSSNLERVKTVYEEIARYQINCSSTRDLTVAKCLEDTIKTCEIILSKGSRKKSDYQLLLQGLRNFNDYKIGEPITEFDLQKYAFAVDILASKLLKLLVPSLKAESEIDYFIKTGIKKRELQLIAEEQMGDFLKHCITNHN